MVSTLIDQTASLGFDDDSRLVDRALAGDASAFVMLYEKYYGKVYSIAKGVLLDADEAEDAVQEVFSLVYRNLQRFNRRSRFSTWLFRVAVNRCIQESRKRRFRQPTVLLEEQHEPATNASGDSDASARVEATMSQLLPGDRALLTLFYWDELSLTEIGETLDCTANAAKTRLFRARDRFREVYERGEV